MKIFGPPGTGKTTFLSSQIRAAAERFGSDHVMVASFTKAAAAELVGRDLPLDRDMIGTLHAHCYRQLQHPTIANDKKVIVRWNEKFPEWALTAQDSGPAIDDPMNEGEYAGDGDELFNQMNVYRAKMVDRSMWPLMKVRQFADSWDNWKRSEGVMDFTDLIEYCYKGTSSPPGSPRVIFLDECQDMSKLEMALALKWGSDVQNVVLAADDDQAIFNFKGADPEAFLSIPVSESHERILSQSYRVPRAVQEYSQHWIKHVKNRKEKAYNPRDFEGEIVRANYGTWRSPDNLIATAKDYMAQGKSVMFLATCSYMLNEIKTALRKNGVPYHNPYRRSRHDWNPLQPARGVSTVERLLSFMRLDEKVWGDQSRMWTVGDVKRWGDMLKADGVFQRGAKGRLADMEDDNEEIETTKLTELFTDNAFSAIFDTNVSWLYENAATSYRKTLEFPLNVAKFTGWQGLKEQPRIILGTIHSVKGGESDVVFVFPDLSMRGYEEWESPGRDAIYRQFYVGFTRAKETLVLCGRDSMRAVQM